MVEILHPADDGSSSTSKLLYSKSKAYVQPTSFTKDNIEGFAAIVEQRVSPFFPSFDPYVVLGARMGFPNFRRACRIPTIVHGRPWVVWTGEGQLRLSRPADVSPPLLLSTGTKEDSSELDS